MLRNRVFHAKITPWVCALLLAVVLCRVPAKACPKKIWSTAPDPISLTLTTDPDPPVVCVGSTITITANKATRTAKKHSEP